MIKWSWQTVLPEKRVHFLNWVNALLKGSRKRNLEINLNSISSEPQGANVSYVYKLNRWLQRSDKNERENSSFTRVITINSLLSDMAMFRSLLFAAMASCMSQKLHQKRYQKKENLYIPPWLWKESRFWLWNVHNGKTSLYHALGLKGLQTRGAYRHSDYWKREFSGGIIEHES